LLKLGGAMVLIVGFAIIGMASSWIIAESVQGSGEAINLAGSLRMQTYRMTSLVLSMHPAERVEAADKLRTAVTDFEVTLNNAHIRDMMPKQTVTALLRSYETVLDDWGTRVK